MPEAWDADSSIKRFVLSESSQLHQQLCNPDANGDCQLANTVILDDSLQCTGNECRVDNVVVVQVAPGTFYEYVRKPCVDLVFFEGAKKVVTGFDWVPKIGRQYVSLSTE
jgi:hypothetical protein